MPAPASRWMTSPGTRRTATVRSRLPADSARNAPAATSDQKTRKASAIPIGCIVPPPFHPAMGSPGRSTASSIALMIEVSFAAPWPTPS